MTRGSRSLSPKVAMRGGSPGRARGAPQLMVRPAPGHVSPATAGRPSAARKSPSVEASWRVHRGAEPRRPLLALAEFLILSADGRQRSCSQPLSLRLVICTPWGTSNREPHGSKQGPPAGGFKCGDRMFQRHRQQGHALELPLQWVSALRSVGGERGPGVERGDTPVGVGLWDGRPHLSAQLLELPAGLRPCLLHLPQTGS